MKIAVSILVSNYSEEETILKINETDADYLHVDVTDGHFVPDKTPEREYLHLSHKPLNVHLMVSRPFSYISKYAAMKAETISISSEIEDDKLAILEYIKSLGVRCGMAIKPGTTVSALEDYFDILDEIIVLTVEPGKGGQKMKEEVLEKVDELVRLRDEFGYKYTIMVDGGINDKNIVKASKADIVVVGSYICKSEDFQSQIDRLRL